LKNTAWRFDCQGAEQGCETSSGGSSERSGVTGER